MKQNEIFLDGRKLLHSFSFALKGVNRLLETEQNAKIHLIVTFITFFLAIFLRVSRLEAAILFMAVIMVFALEIINTAVEKMLDLLHPDNHETIAKVKDALSGAVLISAFIAVVVAFLIFYPHLKALYYNLT